MEKTILNRNKKGDLEWDEIGKLIIALVVLIIIIYIITIIINGEFTSQGEKIGDAFGIF